MKDIDEAVLIIVVIGFYILACVAGLLTVAGFYDLYDLKTTNNISLIFLFSRLFATLILFCLGAVVNIFVRNSKNLEKIKNSLQKQ